MVPGDSRTFTPRCYPEAGRVYRDKADSPQRLKELAAEFSRSPGCPKARQARATRTRQSPESCATVNLLQVNWAGLGAMRQPGQNIMVPRHRNARASAVRNRARQIVEKSIVYCLGSVTTARHKEMGSVQGLQTFITDQAFDLG